MNRALPFAVAAAAVLVFSIWYGNTTPRVLQPDTAEDAADFPNYYFGGERLLEGRAVYDPLTREIEQTFSIPAYDTYPADPPSTIALFAPFSLLSYRTAWLAWSAVSILLLFGSMYAVAREVGYAAPWATAIGAVSLLTNPARFLFTRNHMETLLLVLGVAGWLALRRRRDAGAAVAFGLATGLKLFPGMWLLGLTRRNLRAGLLGFAIAAGALAAGMLILGLDNTGTFLTDVISRSRRWYGSLGNYSLVSFGTALVGVWFGWLLVALAVLVLVPRYLARPRDPDTLWILGTTAALVLSPLSWINYLVLALPALVIVSCRINWRRPPERIGFLAAVGALAFWGPVVLGSELPSVLVSFVPTYALVGLFFFVARERSWQETLERPSPNSA